MNEEVETTETPTPTTPAPPPTATRAKPEAEQEEPETVTLSHDDGRERTVVKGSQSEASYRARGFTSESDED